MDAVTLHTCSCWRVRAAVALLAVMGYGCGGSGGSDTGSGLPTGVERVFPDLSFARITDIRSRVDGAGNERLFVVEQGGTIRYFDPQATVPVVQTYLDVSGIPGFSDNGEEGLLGLAFDPDHASNGFLYVHVVRRSPRRVAILRFRDDRSPPVDVDTEVTVLEADEFDSLSAFTNHVAGGMAFGPVDGHLYLTMGDGGDSFDPDGAAQDLDDLRGSILRIDVDGTTGTSSATNYGIPADNPHVGTGFREEIFAHGLRNPFRISIERIDSATQRVWVGDVGQNTLEEIDVIESGGNHGWDCREGTRVVSDANDSSACDSLDDADFTPPVHEYDRSQGRSVTGGYVYSGERFADTLAGRYVHGDFISGRIWAFDPVSGDNVLLVDTTLRISTFGTGTDGELYIGDYGGGLYRLVR